MSKLAYEWMRDSLEQLHLGRALETVDSLLDCAAGGKITTVDPLDQLLTAELAIRRERSIAMRLKLAGLPAVKTLEQFDFAFQPSLDQEKIRDLHTLRFMSNGHNVTLLGPPGCGKTHSGTSLGHAAITAGELVHFTTAVTYSRNCEVRRARTRNSNDWQQRAQSYSLSTKLATSRSTTWPRHICFA